LELSEIFLIGCLTVNVRYGKADQNNKHDIFCHFVLFIIIEQIKWKKDFYLIQTT
jgi:hypothetical protein